MAEHGEVQYATADGNDLPAHEAEYSAFVHLAYVATLTIASIVLGLTIGAVVGHWFAGVSIIILSVIVGAYGLWSGARIPSAAMVVLAGLTLLYTAYN